jgi:hypothetical protein
MSVIQDWTRLRGYTSAELQSLNASWEVGTHPQIEKPISELLSRSKSSLSARCVRQLRQALFPLT